jgi:hypothetical protein
MTVAILSAYNPSQSSQYKSESWERKNQDVTMQNSLKH